MHIRVLGIDLAKNVFQLCAINQAGKEVFNRQVRRAKLASTVSNLEPDLIAMEACSSAHYWGRRFEAMGHRVALIPAQHVQAFVRVNKSDAHDMPWPSPRPASVRTSRPCRSSRLSSRICR